MPRASFCVANSPIRLLLQVIIREIIFCRLVSKLRVEILFSNILNMNLCCTSLGNDTLCRVIPKLHSSLEIVPVQHNPATISHSKKCLDELDNHSSGVTRPNETVQYT